MSAAAIDTEARVAAQRHIISERTGRRIVDSAIERAADAIAEAFARPAT